MKEKMTEHSMRLFEKKGFSELRFLILSNHLE